MCNKSDDNLLQNIRSNYYPESKVTNMSANKKADGEKGVCACMCLNKHLDTHLHSHKQSQTRQINKTETDNRTTTGGGIQTCRVKD